MVDAILVTALHRQLPRLNHFLLLSDARDKSLKLIQYALKIVLAHHSPRNKKQLKALINACSSARKMIRLGHWLVSLNEIVNVRGKSSFWRVFWSNDVWAVVDTISPFVDVFNDIADDLYALGKFGVLSKHVQHRAEPWSNHLWFISILISLSEQYRSYNDLIHRIEKSKHPFKRPDEKEYTKEHSELQEKLYWWRISTVKLVMDLCFCGYDVFPWMQRKIPTDHWQAWSGMCSGMLATYKLYVKSQKTFSS